MLAETLGPVTFPCVTGVVLEREAEYLLSHICLSYHAELHRLMLNIVEPLQMNSEVEKKVSGLEILVIRM